MVRGGEHVIGSFSGESGWDGSSRVAGLDSRSLSDVAVLALLSLSVLSSGRTVLLVPYSLVRGVNTPPEGGGSAFLR